jgi:hypothetical protein
MGWLQTSRRLDKTSPSSSSELDRLFRRLDRAASRDGDALWNVDVFLAAPPGSAVVETFTSISGRMNSLSLCVTPQNALRICLYCDGPVSLMAVDINQFENNEDVIDWLLGVRDVNPQLPVLLITSPIERKEGEIDPRRLADWSVGPEVASGDLNRALESTIQSTSRRLKGLGWAT